MKGLKYWTLICLSMSLVSPLFFPLLCHHGWKLKVEIVTSSRAGRDGHSIPSGLSETKWKNPAKLKWCSSMFPQCAFNYDVDISQHLATSVRSRKPLTLWECAQRSSFIWKVLVSWCVSWQLFCLVCEGLVAKMFQAFVEIWSRSALCSQSCYLLLQYV